MRRAADVALDLVRVIGLACWQYIAHLGNWVRACVSMVEMQKERNGMQLKSEDVVDVFDAMFTQCGLNADWCVCAWHLGIGEPNKTDGELYLIDNEDESYSIVIRHYAAEHGEPSEDFIYPLVQFKTPDELMKWIGRNVMRLTWDGVYGVTDQAEAYLTALEQWQKGTYNPCA